MSGYQVCQKIRKIEAFNSSFTKDLSSTPVLFITSADTIENRTLGFEAGATEFMIKPFLRGDLLAVLKKMFTPVIGFGDKTVLIVEDSLMTLRHISATLLTEGINNLTALNGKEGLEILRNNLNEIDLIITDYIMPEMDGEQLCRHVREKLGLVDLPIVFLTASSETESIVKMFDAGATDLIKKPFCKEELIARVQIHLKEGGLRKNLIKKVTELKIAMEKLSRVAITDSLTQLYNRGYIFEVLNDRIKEAKRYGTPLNILMLDIDHFKAVNDKFGHQKGDEVLIAVSNVISNQIREIDIVGRYGGEEFLVIFPNTDKSGAIRAAEKVRKAIEALDWKGIKLKTTISGGIAEFKNETDLNLVEKADQLLYLAKGNGRNKICA